MSVVERVALIAASYALISNNNRLPHRSQAGPTHLFGVSVISAAGSANTGQSHRKRTVYTDTVYLDWHTAHQLISCCFGSLYM